MRTALGWLLPAIMLPLIAYAQEVTVKETYDVLAVRDSIIANVLQKHDNPFTLYPYDTNYLIYTSTNDTNKETISNYSQSENARKDGVKLQLNPAFPFRRGILGPSLALGGSYIRKSWWRLSNSEEPSLFHETNYEPRLFLGFATDYRFASRALRDVEMGYNHDSSGQSDPISRSRSRLYTRLMAENGSQLVEVKPWYVIGNTDDNPDITRYMDYYQLKMGHHLGNAVISVKDQCSQNTGYDDTELGASYPVTKRMRLHIQVYSGYGESPIDYSFNQTHAGVGVMLSGIF